MKLYNPFRPHLVRRDNQCAVRKLTIAGWVFADASNMYPFWWFLPAFVDQYCTMSSQAKAQHLLHQINAQPAKWKRL